MISKIRTREEIARTKKKNQIWVGVIMISLLVLSTVGYSLISGGGGGSESYIKEVGIDFFYDGGIWKAEINGVGFGFNYLPSEVSEVFIEGNYNLENYYGNPLYFLGDNEGNLEILRNIGPYALRYQEVCLDGEICKGDFPLKNCSSNILIFQSSNDSLSTYSGRVYQNESCVYFVGDPVKTADAFLYRILGIN
jgi:hypothetical protein